MTHKATLAKQKPAEKPLFSLTNHRLSYQDHHVFNDISLTINHGEKVAIIGPSGVGKTSLLNILYAQQPEKIAFCQQKTHLIANLSAYNNIYLGRLNEFSNWQNFCNLISANQEQWQVISKIARQLAIESQLKKSTSQLSGGQQQRVAIARCLYQNKTLFFADEPVSSLDTQLAHQVLQQLVTQHQCCIVALHDKQLALDHFDRIIGLQRDDSINHSHIVIDQSTTHLRLKDLDELYH